jgi:hypothetical protein
LRVIVRLVALDEWAILTCHPERMTTLRQLKEQALLVFGLVRFQSRPRLTTSPPVDPGFPFPNDSLTSTIESASDRVPTPTDGSIPGINITVTTQVTAEDEVARVHLLSQAEQDHRRLAKEADQWQLYSPSGVRHSRSPTSRLIGAGLLAGSYRR